MHDYWHDVVQFLSRFAFGPGVILWSIATPIGYLLAAVGPQQLILADICRDYFQAARIYSVLGNSFFADLLVCEILSVASTHGIIDVLIGLYYCTTDLVSPSMQVTWDASHTCSNVTWLVQILDFIRHKEAKTKWI